MGSADYDDEFDDIGHGKDLHRKRSPSHWSIWQGRMLRKLAYVLPYAVNIPGETSQDQIAAHSYIWNTESRNIEVLIQMQNHLTIYHFEQSCLRLLCSFPSLPFQLPVPWFFSARMLLTLRKETNHFKLQNETNQAWKGDFIAFSIQTGPFAMLWAIFCSDNFPTFSLSYWGAHSYYPRGPIMREERSPNSRIEWDR